jgi:hypothetical protein
MYKYKYNKYIIKFTNLMHTGGGNIGCCSSECGRNPKQITIIDTNKINLICCDLCLKTNGEYHTKKCNDYLSDDICNCGRILPCGITLNKDDKINFCCDSCETGINKHSGECDARNIKFSQSLSLQKDIPEELSQSNQNEKNKHSEQNEQNIQNPPLKKVLGEINAKMKNDLKGALNDIESIIKSYKIDKLEQVISRFLYETLNSKESKIDGFNFFNKYFLGLKFPITEQIAVNGLKLMNLVDVPLPIFFEFIERLSKNVKFERRIISESLKYCQKNKLKDNAIALIRFGIVNNVIFTKEEFGIMLSIFCDSKNTKEIIEILNYMKTQDYKDINFSPIPSFVEELLCSIYDCKKTEINPYYTENTKHKIKFSEKKTYETKHQQTLSMCGINLPKFYFTNQEKNRLINAMINKLGSFSKKIDEQTENKHIDYVIDGANVGYQFEDGGKNKYMSFKKINMIATKLIGNIIIFLHSAHLNKVRRPKKQATNIDSENSTILESWLSSPNITLIETPYNENDDYSWIYTTLKHNAMLVSKDNMNDHYDKIFKNIVSAKFRLWQSLHQIYHETLAGDVVELSLPPICLKKIQLVVNKWFFPLENNQWLCVNIE